MTTNHTSTHPANHNNNNNIVKKNKKTQHFTNQSQCSYLNDDVIPFPRLTLTTSSVLVMTLCVLCFWNAQHATFTFDDNSAILGNRDIRHDETSVTSIFGNDFWGTSIKSNLSHKSYRPLTVFTYRWNYFLAGGYKPWGFHVVNICLHVVNSVLLLHVFSVMFGDGRMIVGADGCSIFTAPKASLLATILFAIHPIHTESVRNNFFTVYHLLENANNRLLDQNYCKIQ